MQPPVTANSETTSVTLERLQSRSEKLSSMEEFEDWNREIQSTIEVAERTDDPTLTSLVQLKTDVYSRWVKPVWRNESQEATGV